MYNLVRALVERSGAGVRERSAPIMVSSGIFAVQDTYIAGVYDVSFFLAALLAISWTLRHVVRCRTLDDTKSRL